jgi:hypothetical protein
MKQITILISVLNLFLFGCGNTSNENPKEQRGTAIHEEHNHNEESEAIKLNNGEKWKVDANMITHIRNMENDVISFAKVEPKDYKALSAKLQSNIDLLTSNCTMEGKAHDELHKWLLPYIDLVNELAEAKEETKAEKQFQKIENSFITFNQYFQ